MANKNIPQIRFKGFDGEWEEQELCDTSVCSIDTGCPFDSKDFDENGKYLVITNGNIQDDTTFVNSNDCNRITIDEKSSYHLKKGEILITMDGTVGRSAIVNDYGMVLAQRVGRLKPIINGYFLYYLLNTGNFSKTMIAIGHGGTIKHISLDEIGSYKLRVAKSDKEQTRIASLFTSLDKQISCSEAKLDKLRTIKKTLLKKMFASQGEKTPQIRFKGFDGEWEEKMLGEIGKVFDGTHFTPNYTEYGIPFYSVESIVSGLPPKHISVEDHKKNTQTNKPQKGDILITRIGSLCNVKQIEYDGEYSIYVSLADIQVKTLYNSTFILYYLQTQDYKEDFLMRSLTTAVPQKINMNELKSTIVKHSPNISEQTRIASLFTALDKQISCQEKKIEKLKAVKRTLLKKMFV